MFGDGAGVKTPRSKKKKGRLKETVAAPVVPCGCCAAGLAPAHTAAVWLSVWAAGITGRPFTPAQTAVCSPSPSALVHSASSIISSSASLHRGGDFYLPHFILCTPNLSVCLCSHLSPPPFPPPPLSILCFFSLQPSLSLSFFFAFQLTQKHKQQQLGAVIVLLWNSIAFSVKDGVVNNKLHIRKGKKKKALQCEPGQQVSERLNRRPWRLRVWAVLGDKLLQACKTKGRTEEV